MSKIVLSVVCSLCLAAVDSGCIAAGKAKLSSNKYVKSVLSDGSGETLNSLLTATGSRKAIASMTKGKVTRTLRELSKHLWNRKEEFVNSGIKICYSLPIRGLDELCLESDCIAEYSQSHNDDRIKRIVFELYYQWTMRKNYPNAINRDNKYYRVVVCKVYVANGFDPAQ